MDDLELSTHLTSEHNGSPEELMWMSCLYQALSDLEKPERWSYVPHSQRQFALNPLKNDVYRSAFTTLFSGREDDHILFTGAKLEPEILRKQVLDMMQEGSSVRRPLTPGLPFYGVDYRKARINLMRVTDWAKRRFRSPLSVLFAPDCHAQVKRLLAM